MKHLLIFSVFAVFCLPALVFSQKLPTWKTPFQLAANARDIAPTTSRNDLTKRLSGESDGRFTSENTVDLNFGDSVQYFYYDHQVFSEIRLLQFSGGVWTMQYRALYVAYDSLDRVTEKRYQSTADNGATWTNTGRTLFSRSHGFNIDYVYITEESWDETTQTWQQISQSEYDYDAHGNQTYSKIGSTIYYWLHSYNADGFLIESAQSGNFGQNNSFVMTNRTTYGYSAAHPGLPIFENNYIYNAWGSSWMFRDSTAFLYDNAGKLLQKDLYDYWNSDPPLNCNTIYRTTQTFDAQHYLINNVLSVKCIDDTSSVWFTLAKEDFINDAEGDLVYSQHSDYYFGDTSVVFHRNTYETVSQAQQPVRELAFNYYPNPASDAIFIKIEQDALLRANVLDSKGNLLKSNDLDGMSEQVISVSDLPAGVFFLEIMARDGNRSVKPLVIAR